MPADRAATDRIEIKVKAAPNAQKDMILGVKNGELIIKINAAPEDGKANKALISFLAKELKIAKSEVSILRGENSRRKVLSVPNTSEIRAKLTCYEEAKGEKAGFSSIFGDRGCGAG